MRDNEAATTQVFQSHGTCSFRRELHGNAEADDALAHNFTDDDEACISLRGIEVSDSKRTAISERHRGVSFEARWSEGTSRGADERRRAAHSPKLRGTLARTSTAVHKHEC